jgi:hypothetical protein
MVEDMRRRALLVGIVLLAPSALAACTTTTGTRLSPSQSDISKIKRLGMLVRADEAFSVRRAREKLTNTGAAVGGLLGAAIEAGVRTSADTRDEESLKPITNSLDPSQLLGGPLKTTLTTTAFPTVSAVSSVERAALRGEGLDAVLDVTLKEWGLRVCTTSDHTDDVQAAYRVHGRLVLADSGSMIWERHELFLDGTCRPISAFRTQEGLLSTTMSQAATELARRIVNELLYP